MAPLHRFHHLNLSSAEFPGQLIALLHERGYKDNVKSLQHDDSVWLAEYLDNVRLAVISAEYLPRGA